MTEIEKIQDVLSFVWERNGETVHTSLCESLQMNVSGVDPNPVNIHPPGPHRFKPEQNSGYNMISDYPIALASIQLNLAPIIDQLKVILREKRC